LLKLQKEQPNNLQIAEALKDIKYRRKTPNTAQWSKTKIGYEVLKSEYANKPKKVKMAVAEEKKMFSIGVRFHTTGIRG